MFGVMDILGFGLIATIVWALVAMIVFFQKKKTRLDLADNFEKLTELKRMQEEANVKSRFSEMSDSAVIDEAVRQHSNRD